MCSTTPRGGGHPETMVVVLSTTAAVIISNMHLSVPRLHTTSSDTLFIPKNRYRHGVGGYKTANPVRHVQPWHPATMYHSSQQHS